MEAAIEEFIDLMIWIQYRLRRYFRLLRSAIHCNRTFGIQRVFDRAFHNWTWSFCCKVISIQRGWRHRGRWVRLRRFKRVPYRHFPPFFQTGSPWFILEKGKWFIFRRRLWRSWFVRRAMSQQKRLWPVHLRWWRCYRVWYHRLWRLADGRWKRRKGECTQGTRVNSLRIVFCWGIPGWWFNR